MSFNEACLHMCKVMLVRIVAGRIFSVMPAGDREAFRTDGNKIRMRKSRKQQFGAGCDRQINLHTVVGTVGNWKELLHHIGKP